MNPRLVEPGFAVVCLHADVPARPGKDENRRGPRAGSTTTLEEAGYLHSRRFARAAGASMSPSRDRYSRRAPAQDPFNRSVWVDRAAIPIRDRRLSM